MEKELSLILLIVAGLILVFLFIYSFRTRAIRDDEILLNATKTDEFADDAEDVLTRPNAYAGDSKQSEFIKPISNMSAPQLFQAELDDSEIISIRTVSVEDVKKTEYPENFTPSNLLMLQVLPKEGKKFIGYDLLQALLVANLRFGKMAIFHRYTQPMGEGKILFSVAQVTEPGTFNINAMGSCHCAGLALFMQLIGPEHNLEILEAFINTAQQLADTLRGEIAVGKKREAFTHDVKKQFTASVQYHLNKLSVAV